MQKGTSLKRSFINPVKINFCSPCPFVDDEEYILVQKRAYLQVHILMLLSLDNSALCVGIYGRRKRSTYQSTTRNRNIVIGSKSTLRPTHTQED